MKIVDGNFHYTAETEFNLVYVYQNRSFYPCPSYQSTCELVTGNVRGKLKTNFRDMRVHTRKSAIPW